MVEGTAGPVNEFVIADVTLPKNSQNPLSAGGRVMDTTRLHEILRLTTSQFRKGETVNQHKVGAVGVTEVYAMPHESSATGVELVDVHFIKIGVDKEKAAAHKDELIKILNEYPNPERLAGGPSYIEVGGALGDQGAAFCLFALGKVLGLWSVITPESLGMTGEDAHRAAGNGYIMISGYGHEADPQPALKV